MERLKRLFDIACEAIEVAEDTNTDGEGSDGRRVKRICPDRPHQVAWANMQSVFFSASATKHLQTVFRIPYFLFTQLTQELREHDGFWVQERSATNRLGVTTEMKVLIALKVLGHGVTTASVEAEFQVGETLARRCVDKFIVHVLELYEQKELKDLLTDEEKFKDVLKVNER